MKSIEGIDRVFVNSNVTSGVFPNQGQVVSDNISSININSISLTSENIGTYNSYGMFIDNKVQFKKNFEFESFYSGVISTIEEMGKYNDIDKEAVLVIGKTGVGKSTLINCLLGEKAIAVPQPDSKKDFDISFDNPQAKVGFGFSSETSVPKRYISSTKVYWDCPGFNDNRGAMTELVNMFGMQKINDKTNSFKILVVIDEETVLKQRYKPFMDVISTITAMFKDEKLADSVTFCFTKAKSLLTCCKSELVSICIEAEKSLREKVQNNTINNIGAYLFKSDIDFLRKIIQSGRFVIFPAPKKEGIISGSYKSDVIESINDSTAMKVKIEPIMYPIFSEDYYNLYSYTDNKASYMLDRVKDMMISFFPKVNNDNLQKLTNYFIEKVYPIRTESDIEILDNLYCMSNLFLVPNDTSILKNIEELKFLSSEVCSGILGKFDSDSEYFSMKTFDMPLRSILSEIRGALKQRGLGEFLISVDKELESLGYEVQNVNLEV